MVRAIFRHIVGQDWFCADAGSQRRFAAEVALLARRGVGDFDALLDACWTLGLARFRRPEEPS